MGEAQVTGGEVDGALPRYVTAYRDRHGKTRYRFRRSGWPSADIPGQPGEDRFLLRYQAALAGGATTRRRRASKSADLASIDRRPYALFCVRGCERARGRARESRKAFDLTPDILDRLLVDQRYRCAVTGIRFDPPGSGPRGMAAPFCPSIDRIVPANGYVAGNVRIVCHIVNCAMGDWGVVPLMQMVAALCRTDLANLNNSGHK